MTEAGRLPATIDVVELDRRLGATDDPRPILVDVREHGEIVASRIAGMVMLPLSQFAVRFRELPIDRPLLVICATGGRSSMASAHLNASGYAASNVVGGIQAWERAGLPVKRGPLTPGEGDLPA